MARPLVLVGAHGSPYSRKIRALLRYRRIPFRWVVRGSRQDVDIPEVPVALIPVLVLPGEVGAPDEATIDSTPMIRRLERLYDARRVVPPDPALAFLDALVEDYADEWVTKAMFHYRWAYSADVEKASRQLPLDRRLDLPPAEHEKLARAFAERQVGRLAIVGSSEATKPAIEESYRRLLALLDAHILEQPGRPFLLGGRPGAADFALFGQLSQLALFDPTPATIADMEAPRVVSWLRHVDDLGGLEIAEGGWTPRGALPGTFRALLSEVGRVYAPFLLANADALARGAERVECEIDGRPFAQTPFRYQAKCLTALREQRASLAAGDRAAADAVLSGTGCEALFA